MFVGYAKSGRRVENKRQHNGLVAATEHLTKMTPKPTSGSQLFDYLISAHKERWGNDDPKCGRGPTAYVKLENGWLLDW